jgi:hypothetical protein
MGGSPSLGANDSGPICARRRVSENFTPFRETIYLPLIYKPNLTGSKIA